MEQSSELKRTKKKVRNLESKLNKAKLALATINQLKAYLAATEQAWDVIYEFVTQA